MIDGIGILSIIFGIFFLAFNKWLSQMAVKSQNVVWGFHFGEKERKGFQITFIVVGIALIVLGCIDMFSFL